MTGAIRCMSIALHSAHLTAASFLSEEPSDEFQHRLSRQLGARIRKATLLSHLLVHGWTQRILYAATYPSCGLISPADAS